MKAPWLARAAWRLGDAIHAAGYDAGASNRVRKDLGFDRASPRDEENMVGKDGSRETMRLKATDLHRNNAVVAGVGNRIALFTVGDGLLPQCHTSDPDWNRAAEENFINVFSPRADSRGRLSLPDMEWMATALRPIHGGLYLEKLSDGTLRPIECERIRQPQDPEVAKSYVDGVKVESSTGRILSYRIHARDARGGFSEKHAEAEVKAENVIPVINRPWRADQVREVPELASVIPCLWDIHEMNQYTLGTAKVQSQLIGFLKKLSGSGGGAFPRGTENPTAGKRQTWQMDWGQILEGFPGEDMDLKSSPTPGAQHIPYVKFQYALCACALGFPYEFLTLDLSGLDFSRQKGMLLLVNHAIRARRNALARQMMDPIWWWRIPLAIRRGELPPAPVDALGVSEFARVSWQGPEEPWIDRQEAMTADLLEIQSGLGHFTGAAKRRGGDLETIYRQKATDFKLRQRIAKEEDVPIEELSKMQMPGQAAPPAAADNSDKVEKSKLPDDKEGMPDE